MSTEGLAPSAPFNSNINLENSSSSSKLISSSPTLSHVSSPTKTTEQNASTSHDQRLLRDSMIHNEHDRVSPSERQNHLVIKRQSMRTSRNRSTRKILLFWFYVLILFSIIGNPQIQIFSEFGSVVQKFRRTRLKSTTKIIRKNGQNLRFQSWIALHKKIDETFVIIYQEIEHRKLSKMAYLEINFCYAKDA